MVFFTLWLQLLGFTDYSASVLMALFAGGCAIGSALGGYLGEPKGILCTHACKTSVVKAPHHSKAQLTVQKVYCLKHVCSVRRSSCQAHTTFVM